jgi:hypothetical protein
MKTSIEWTRMPGQLYPGEFDDPRKDRAYVRIYWMDDLHSWRWSAFDGLYYTLAFGGGVDLAKIQAAVTDARPTATIDYVIVEDFRRR